MANENTARRGVYLPPELDQWFIDQAEKEGRKPNALFLEALNDYVEKHDSGTRKLNTEFERRVLKVLDKYGVKHEAK